MVGWTCDGLPKNGKQYASQSPQGRHKPYDNFGSYCVICGLPKEAMFGKGKAPISLTTAAITALFVCGFGIIGFTLYNSVSTCPTGKQKVGDVCVAITQPTPAPVNIF